MLEQAFVRTVSGESRGGAASLARFGLSLLQHPYAAAVRVRNGLFDAGVKATVDLPRPVVSVGNLTVGGTGKTPVVVELAEALIERGRRPAVLMRGYKAKIGEKGDEQRLLEGLLGEAVPVAADPDRAVAAGRVLEDRADVDVFLLDDGFQHRRVRRAFDLVLIDATRPFGFGHVLPRGLLREPVAGLRRASAVLLTRCDLADTAGVEAEVRRHTAAPIFRSIFTLAEIDAAGPVVAACGIGNPAAFAASLRAAGVEVADLIAFGDHHDFGPADVERIARRLAEVGGVGVVVTAKDWVKLRPLWPGDLPIQVARQHLRTTDEALTEAVLQSI